MPRTPEVCPTTFCPLSRISNIGSSVLRILSSASHQLLPAFCPLPIAFCLLPSAFCLLLLLITHHASLITVHAQGATATLSGAVTDQNDAVIPDVNIEVINIARGFQRSATTNGEGAFVVPLLPPGNYTVKAEHEGFTPTEVRDVVLNVNDQVAIKIHLSVGTLSQTVQIVEGASLINESPAVGTVVDRQFVANLPLNGRSFQMLISLTPGTVVTKTSFAEQGQFSVNGQRSNANYFTVDGVSANVGVSAGSSLGQAGGGSLPGFSAAGSTNNLVSIDALQEFKIQTSTYSPEFGRTPGAQVSIVTRSGTSEFHGTLFDYFRNDALDATDWFANANGLSKPPLRQNDFGGVLGGPIIKNRGFFFFFSYEGLRLRQPLVGITLVPSKSARQNASAALKPFLDAYPVPTGADLSNGLAPFSASFSNPLNLDATSIRLDYAMSDKVTIFGRYNYAPSKTTQRGSEGRSLNTLTVTAFNTQTLTLGATHIITTRVSNEARLNYSRNRGSSVLRLDDFGGAIVPDGSVLLPPFASIDSSFFRFTITGTPSLSIGRLSDNLQRQINLVDSLSFVTGSHQFKFGIDYRRLVPLNRPREYNQAVTFRGIGVTLPGVPPPIGTILSGRASSVSIDANDSVALLISNFSAYGQDTWRITPRLTLTYGLRYELNPVPKGRDGNDLITVRGLENPGTISLAPAGTPLYETTYGNFAPRIGVAYQLTQKPGRETVLRGGFGIFYDLGAGQAANAARTFPYNRTKSLRNVSYPLDPDSAAPPPLRLTPPVDNIFAFDPHLTLPRTYQWNASLERSLLSNQTFSITYLGAAGRRLLRQETLSSPNLDFQTIQVTRNTATSDYHALQLQYDRRLSQGLRVLASYTWSHSIDIASNDSSTSNTPADRINIRTDRASSDFDVRHAFSAASTYKIPSPRGGTVLHSLLRNWSVDTIVTARSATPVDLIGGVSFIGFISTARPDLISSVPLYVSDPSVAGERRFNRNAFALVPVDPFGSAVRQGTLGRNVLRGFPVYQVDLALRRQLNLTEKVNLQLRAEAFNIFNHPNFGDPVGDLLGVLGLGPFGQSNSMLGRSLGSGGVNGGFNPLYQVGGPRSLQFSFKLGF
ncbi:MAG TPA: TonB-dependent receptor [Pyrinomonadaceae bacterium]